MEIQDLLAKHKTIKSFGNEYGIIIHPEKYRNDVECINACSPTLNDLQVAYGSRMKVWLQEQIDLLQKITGVRDKLLAHQVVMLIETFLTNGNVKASMLMNFFHKLISGQYGRFYGSIDIMQIGECWQSYIENCRSIYNDQKRKIRDEEQARLEAEKKLQFEKSRENAITYDEFRKIQKEQSGVDAPPLNQLLHLIFKTP